MAAEKIHIEQFIELTKQHPVIDVRSPGEYIHAHIPGAHSLPLFTDEERKVVGTTYKQQSREAAIKIGLDFFGPKMNSIVESTESLVGSQKSKGSELPTHNSRLILLYCWRGGMRSGAVSWLLDLYGFKVYTLIGGYKKFRNYVLDTFKLPFQINIVGGYTGSGKTELLKTLREKGEPVIDLEDIAKHKGSAFGSIGMPQQPTQEMFENILATELNTRMTDSREPMATINPVNGHPNPAYRLWLEDESQRIGHVNIPNDLWSNMRKSPVYFLDIPFEERLKHITEEYGCLDKQPMIDAIDRIKEKLGGQNAKLSIQLLKEENSVESFRILLKYYDKFYFKSLHNREQLNSLLHTVECKSVTPENASQLIRHPQYQST
ncbi:MAG TPA: tRNA 2-selenouridine(34) synthase MnmH [Chitinophagaceae bacterium]|nr:tRNA 2-selenouridine(34) synthase MnmH [Chitinophagaceae bacterium]